MLDYRSFYKYLPLSKFYLGIISNDQIPPKTFSN